MKLADMRTSALDLPDPDRVALAAEFLVSLPAVLADEDDGIAEAMRRSKAPDEDPSMGSPWGEIKQSPGR